MSMKHDEGWLKENRLAKGSTRWFYEIPVDEHAKSYHEHQMRLRPASEYEDGMGDVLWFCGNKPAVMGDEMNRDMTDDLDDHIEAITHFQIIQVPES